MAWSHLVPVSAAESSVALVFSDEAGGFSPQRREGRARRKSLRLTYLAALLWPINLDFESCDIDSAKL